MLDLPWITVRGLHALKVLAREEGPLTSGALAREVHVTPTRAARLFRQLKSAGLISSAGHRGWILARPAGDITVLDVVESLGSSSARPERCQADWTMCRDRGSCSLAPLCRQAHERLIEVFRGHTLADLRAEMPALP